MGELSAEGARTRLRLQADSLEWAAGMLAGLGAEFEVVRPDELREQLARLAARLGAAAQPRMPKRRAP
jgi:predicted DNA-binding transcriptional regulator YafY